MKTKEAPLRISNWNYAGAQLLLGLCVLPVFGGIITWAFFSGMPGPNAGTEVWILVLIVAAVIVVGGFYAAYVALTTPVLWIELGDRLHFRTALRRLSCPWSEVISLKFVDEQGRLVASDLPGISIPLGVHRVVVIQLQDRRELRAKVTVIQQAAIERMWARRGALL